MKQYLFRSTFLLSLLIFGSSFLFAEVELPGIFNHSMVLQRDMKTPIWGWAAQGETVSVQIAGQKKTTRPDLKGRWIVRLDPIPAGGPFELVVSGTNKIVLKNVLIGDVWLCGGQSNMEVSVGGSDNAKEELAAANHPMIRLITIPKRAELKPNENSLLSGWYICNPKSVRDFSGVGYFFGRALQKELNVPIGLVNVCWGASTCETWIPKEVLEKFADFRPLMNEQYLAKIIPQRRACQSWNAMLAPIKMFGIRGAIWYQGESNATRAEQHERLFPVMIQAWREEWHQGDFPFYFVQLTSFYKREPAPGESYWAELRETQSRTLRLPKTGQAVTIDIGNAENIHPTNKQDVGDRLARIALANEYGRDIVFSGPEYLGMKIDGSNAILSFRANGGGLAIGRDGKSQKLLGFAIAGTDRKFYWADARIDGEQVIVTSEKVIAPVAVRYAWANNPECNLYNKAGLPASPFRTDEWPRKTLNKVLKE